MVLGKFSVMCHYSSGKHTLCVHVKNGSCICCKCFSRVLLVIKVYFQLYLLFLISLPEVKFKFHFGGISFGMIPTCPTLNMQNTDSWALLRVSDSGWARGFAFLTRARAVLTQPAQGLRSAKLFPAALGGP